MSATILQGDCIERMAQMDEASVDAVVCDPPAGISFMGKSWDGNRGGRDSWIGWMTEVMSEALRVCKPGAHAAARGRARRTTGGSRMNQPLPPAAHLLQLEAEAQDLYPGHTFKAVIWHVNQLGSVEEKCESLEAGMAEFRRGLVG